MLNSKSNQGTFLVDLLSELDSRKSLGGFVWNMETTWQQFFLYLVQLFMVV